MACLTLKNGKPAIEPMEDPAEHFQQIEAAEIALRDHVLRKDDLAAKNAEVAAPPPEPPKKIG